MSKQLFRLVLALSGLFIMFTGLNVALGGITTLGWLGPTDFLTITDPGEYHLQDNHVRFFGGVWTTMGLFLWFALPDPAKYRQTLYIMFVLIFAGGIARLASLNFEVLFGPELIGSLAAELVGMPILAYWLSKLPDTQD